MTGFEFLFSLYGLLLGLAIANATGAIMEFWRAPRALRGGVMTPLLASFVLLAAAEQWLSMWGARDLMTISPAMVLVSLGMALPYIFISLALSPPATTQVSFSDYYFGHRRTLMAVLCVPALVSLGANLVIQGLPTLSQIPDVLLWFCIQFLPRLLIPAILAVSRSARVHVAGLVLLNAYAIFSMWV
ncbi:MAG: hypothetical protein KF910_13690 [Brevundimonas sp.]|uniref:hypothetical protein n=1 Tax=Brevundimonas sp. TaxID=1871086 RepID=UPI0025BAFEAA|nr:hypothetical protein [Brevundimonas sp.]MBX3478654.1 hypothetical protein [Brevundimonas sp.]